MFRGLEVFFCAFRDWERSPKALSDATARVYGFALQGMGFRACGV